MSSVELSPKGYFRNQSGDMGYKREWTGRNKEMEQEGREGKEIKGGKKGRKRRRGKKGGVMERKGQIEANCSGFLV